MGPIDFVIPSTADAAKTSPLPPEEKGANKGNSGTGTGGGGSGYELHPFIQGLIAKLPPPDSQWDTADQVKWLKTAANIFGLMYESTGETIEIRVVHDG